MSDQHPAHETPTQVDLDRFSEGLTKVVAQAMTTDLIQRPEEFFLVSVRTCDAWNMATGRRSDWLKDTISLTEAETLREIAGMLDIGLTPPDGKTPAEVADVFNRILTALRSDLIARADDTDPT